jgi:hypothetical protein
MDGIAAPGYDTLIPVQGVTILGGPYQDIDTLDNPITTNYINAVDSGGIMYPALGLGYDDALIDNERMGLRRYMYELPLGAPNPYMYPPNSVNEYYNFLQGKWSDGSPLFYGSYGYAGAPGVTSTQSDFAFFGSSDPYYLATHGVAVPASWVENLAGMTLSERTSMGSMGPFTLAPGAYNEVDIALTFACDYIQYYQPLAGLPILQQRVDTIRNYFISGMTPCGTFTFNSTPEIQKKEISFSMYPNPANNNFTISFEKIESSTTWSIYDVLGNAVMSGNVRQTKTSIDVSGISDGIYVLEITNGK